MRNKLNINRRALILFSIFFIFMCLLSVRIIYLQTGFIYTVKENFGERKMIIAESRGNIYDRNMKKLVNSSVKEKAVILPGVNTSDIVEPENQNISKSGPVIVSDDGESYTDNKYIKKFLYSDRYDDEQLCRHITGYLDDSGSGVCGIEKAFDGILKKHGGKLYALYEADGRGNPVPGKGLELIDDNYSDSAGIVLTLDKNIQQTVENALFESDIKCGAVIVLDVKTSAVLASASVPVYDINNPGKDLKNKDEPFINRAFQAYPVGSVFKPFIAAAALINGYDDNEEYYCSGSVILGENEFGCYKHKIHGKENLCKAIENSCNTYFIELGLKTGSEKIIKTAYDFGFGKDCKLCSSLISSGGFLPSADSIKSEPELANLCFGQGNLLATPLQIASAYNILANKGIYNEPYILYKTVNSEGETAGYFLTEKSYMAADEEVCRIINECLFSNMKNGTGINAMPVNTTAAGKTATAQTGMKNREGKEKLCTWFAGFFPYEAPEYTVVVFNEKGSSAASDCAPVFKKIAEDIIAFKGNIQ